jgi:hypothetical protein
VFSHVILVCGGLVCLVLVQLCVFSPVILMNKSCLERMLYGMNFVYVRFQVLQTPGLVMGQYVMRLIDR